MMLVPLCWCCALALRRRSPVRGWRAGALCGLKGRIYYFLLVGVFYYLVVEVARCSMLGR